MPEQTYRGTHRHRAPLGWHPPRINPEAWAPDRDTRPGEPTEPFTPTFTGEFPVSLDSLRETQKPAVTEDETAQAEPEVVAPEHRYVKRWRLVLVMVGVWTVAAAVGLGLFYWWFHSINKTPAVFIVMTYLVVCSVAALIAAMVADRPLMSALSIASISAPFASTAAAAVLYGVYFCEHASRCLVGLIPY